MVLTRRGKVTAAIIGALLLGGTTAGAYLLLNRNESPTIASTGEEPPETVDNSDPATPPPPPREPCPLTGEVPNGGVPDHPAIAVKIENLPEARPQAGLAEADIVYEQPVEGGITRFVAVFHCRDADRIGPVRSARFMDANLIPQFGTPLFAYSGAAPPVVAQIGSADVVELSFDGGAADAFTRDPDREMPHDVYTSSASLYEEAGDAGGRPVPVFTYRKRGPRGQPVGSVHLEFNIAAADVYWRWNQSEKRWFRFHGSEAHVVETGEQVSAANVVVQVVDLRDSGIVDARGNPSPEVIVIGTGQAFVFRGGRVIEATWRKDSPEEPTRFFGKGGREIPLAPGTTWVEFLPSRIQVETG